MTILQFLALSFLSIVVFIVVWFFYKYYIKPKTLMRYYEKQGIKISYYYPFLGRFKLMQLGEKKHNDSFYYMKQFLVKNPDCEYAVIFFFDPELQKVFYNSKDIVKHEFVVEVYRKLMNGFVFLEGDEHTRRRKIISQAFHFQLLQSMVPQISDIFDEHFDKIENTRVNDIIVMSCELAGEAIVRLFFSKTFTNAQFKGQSISANVANIVDRIADTVISPGYAIFGRWSFLFGDVAKLQKDIKEIKVLFKSVIEQRVKSTNVDEIKSKDKKDLVDYLLENQGIAQSESDSTLTIDTIIEEFMTFYVGGLDTTGHAFGFALYFLSIYPEWQTKLLEEIKQSIHVPSDLNADIIKNMKYLSAFLNETLRYYTIAVSLFNRIAIRDTQFGDIKVKKGTLVNVGTIENHYNPKYFTDPQTFNPMRWLDGSLDKMGPPIFSPFSAGKHNCIGQHFSQLEMKVGLIKTLQRFDLEIDPNYQLTYSFKFMIYPKNPIPITFKSKVK